MTDENQTTPAPEPEKAPRYEPRWRRSTAFILLVALVAGLAGAFATSALSHGFGFGRWHHGSMEPAEITERADRAVRHLGVEIDATAEQQEKLRSIVTAAVGDLLPMREKMHNARRQARDLLTQPTVDRAAIETFRAEQMALWDQASRRIAQGLADAAEVLTPEQRRRLGAMLPSGGYWRGWHRD